MIRGTNEPHAWYADKTASDLGWQKGWRANTVRVVISGGRWTTNSASDVANVIATCKSNKLICLLENHDTTGYGEASGAYSLSSAADYWISIKSALQGQERYVMVNIGNEPYGNSTIANWTNDTKNAVTKLRNAGLDHVLVVDAPNWGQDNGGVMKNNAASVQAADPRHNLLFSVHMYSQYSSASTITSYIDTFKNNNLPPTAGTLYPILMRLTDQRLLETGWEPSDEPGRPPRHIYRLTTEGATLARQRLAARTTSSAPITQTRPAGGLA
ncbi:cellulase family glycosylhydrolase [Winogradskya humida]|uniref:cellulase family glycosylhydrolase n=1 Tax=Winogradskya humida TaxID=113566 RepID=UPI0027DD130C|nr:cellulase family glycosylhydrolase [Actinoplanes humidus]